MINSKNIKKKKKQQLIRYKYTIYRDDIRLFSKFIKWDGFAWGLKTNSGKELGKILESNFGDLYATIEEYTPGGKELMCTLDFSCKSKITNKLHGLSEDTYGSEQNIIFNSTNIHCWTHLIKRRVVVMERDAKLGYGIVAGFQVCKN